MNNEEINEEIKKYEIGLKVLVKQHNEIEFKMAKVQGILEYLQSKLKKEE